MKVPTYSQNDWDAFNKALHDACQLTEKEREAMRLLEEKSQVVRNPGESDWDYLERLLCIQHEQKLKRLSPEVTRQLVDLINGGEDFCEDYPEGIPLAEAAYQIATMYFDSSCGSGVEKDIDPELIKRVTEISPRVARLALRFFRNGNHDT
jgi:hypothetical protein